MGRPEVFKALAWSNGSDAAPVIRRSLACGRPADAQTTGQSDDWYVDEEFGGYSPTGTCDSDGGTFAAGCSIGRHNGRERRKTCGLVHEGTLPKSFESTNSVGPLGVAAAK